MVERGRVAKHMAAAGMVVEGIAYLRGFLVVGPTNDMRIRDKAANGNTKIRLPNLGAGSSEYVQCDITFNDGMYLTVGGGVPNITLFWD